MIICPGSSSCLLFTCLVFRLISFTIMVLLCFIISVISPILPLSRPDMILTVSPTLTCILCSFGRLFGLHSFRSHRFSCTTTKESLVNNIFWNLSVGQWNFLKMESMKSHCISEWELKIGYFSDHLIDENYFIQEKKKKKKAWTMWFILLQVTSITRIFKKFTCWASKDFQKKCFNIFWSYSKNNIKLVYIWSLVASFL